MEEFEANKGIDSVLVRKTWTLHRLSPLYKFRPEKMAKYAAELTRTARAVSEWQLGKEETLRRQKNGERAMAFVQANKLSNGNGIYVSIEVVSYSVKKGSVTNGKENIENGGHGDVELSQQRSNVVLCCPAEDIEEWDDDVFNFDGEPDEDEIAQPTGPDEQSDEDNEDSRGKRKAKAFSKFPYLLCKGKQNMLSKVFQWLENRFDTTISEKPTPVPPHRLADIAGQCTREAVSGVYGSSSLFSPPPQKEGTVEEQEIDDFDPTGEAAHLEKMKQSAAQSRASQPLELTYGLPSSVGESGLSKIHLAIPGPALKALADELRSITAGGDLHTPSGDPATQYANNGSSSSSSSSSHGDIMGPGDLHDKAAMLARLRQGDMTGLSSNSSLAGASVFAPSLSQEDALLAAVNRFVAQQLNIRLNGASLLQIATPLVMISAEGRVKFLNRQALETILLHLAAICEVETEK